MPHAVIHMVSDHGEWTVVRNSGRSSTSFGKIKVTISRANRVGWGAAEPRAGAGLGWGDSCVTYLWLLVTLGEGRVHPGTSKSQG